MSERAEQKQGEISDAVGLDSDHHGGAHMTAERSRMAGRDDREMFWEHSVVFLKWASALILGASIIFLGALVVVAPEQVWTARGGGPVILALLATTAWALQSRHEIVAAVYVLGIGLWVYATGISLLLGGVNSMYIAVYPLIVIVFGWLMGPRSAIIVAVLTTATCFGFVVAEFRGLLPPRPPTSPVLLWIVNLQLSSSPPS